MASLSARAHLAIYAGRFADKVADALPDGCEVLGEKDASSRLASVIDEADALVVLDPHSFPLESLTEDRRDVPLVVVLARESGHEPVDEALFERLGFFDRIVTPDSARWQELRRRHGWAGCQRIDLDTGDLGDTAARLCGSHQNSRAFKAAHRVQESALIPRFAAMRREDSPLDVLEVGACVGRWAASFDLARTRYCGLDASEDNLENARRNFPERRFDPLGPDLRFPHDDESFDVVFGVDFLQEESPPARAALLSEMWRVTRPGGRLTFLEDFVFERPAERRVPPMPVSGFVSLILETTAYQVVLDHVESLRYPGDDLFRSGVISLLRLGVPKTR